MEVPGSSVILAVVGRYASATGEPFPPRLEVRGVKIRPVVEAQLRELLSACCESTAPWKPKEVLVAKCRSETRRFMDSAGLESTMLEIVVMDDLPHNASAE